MKKIISQSILVNPTWPHIHLSRNKIKWELSLKYIFKSIDSLLTLSPAIQTDRIPQYLCGEEGGDSWVLPLKDVLHFQLWSGSFEGHGTCLFLQEDALSLFLGYFSHGHYSILLKILFSIFTANLHDALTWPSTYCQIALSISHLTGDIGPGFLWWDMNFSLGLFFLYSEKALNNSKCK